MLLLIITPILSLMGALFSWKDGGEHLSPAAFRQVLLDSSGSGGDGSGGSDVAVIDCRNAYESRIGHFDGALQPLTRQFSDFPYVFVQATNLVQPLHI